MGVGKAWISLDSLVRIVTYQWVTMEKRKNFFSIAFVVAKEPSKRLAGGRDRLLIEQLSLISDFLQETVALAVSV
jgi:hypothetical protein